MSSVQKDFPLLATPFKTYFTNQLINVLFSKRDLERDLASLFVQAHRGVGNSRSHGNVHLTAINRTVEHPYLYNGANDSLAAQFAKPVVLKPGELSDQFIQLLSNIDVLAKRLADFKVFLRKIFSRSKTTKDLELYFDKAINPIIDNTDHLRIVPSLYLLDYFDKLNDTSGIENYSDWGQTNLTEEQVDAHLAELEKYTMSFKKHMLIQSLAG